MLEYIYGKGKEHDGVKVNTMIKTLKELISLNETEEGVIMRGGIKVTVTKDSLDTFFNIETKTSPHIYSKTVYAYTKTVKLPNSFIEMIHNDVTSFNATCDNITGTLLYYMAGYNPSMTAKELITMDQIIRGLIYD